MIVSATTNPVLTALLIKFMTNDREFVGLDLFPPFNTALQSANYYVFDRENILNLPVDLRRAPSGSYKRSRMKISDDTFSCAEFGLEEPVDDGERKKYAFAFNADEAAVKRLAFALKWNLEQRVAAKAATLAGNNPIALWDDYQTSNPVTDVDAGREAIHDAVGMDPTVMIVSRGVFNVLKEHPLVRDKYKYTTPGVITEDMLAAVFRVRKFRVAGGIKNSANEGQAVSPAKIWGKDVYLAVTDEAQDLQTPNFGRTFAWNEGGDPTTAAVESYRDEPIKSDVHRARQQVDEKLVGTECGYRLTNVIQ